MEWIKKGVFRARTIFLTMRRHGGTSQSNIDMMISLCSAVTPSGSVSIHESVTGRQPSSELWALFDNVLLLSGGHTALRRRGEIANQRGA